SRRRRTPAWCAIGWIVRPACCDAAMPALRRFVSIPDLRASPRSAHCSASASVLLPANFARFDKKPAARSSTLVLMRDSHVPVRHAGSDGALPREGRERSGVPEDLRRRLADLPPPRLDPADAAPVVARQGRNGPAVLSGAGALEGPRSDRQSAAGG